jgi:SOS-response transcriptional repressor LexA
LHPRGETANRLRELLRQWFGTDAGLPGTGFTVEFTQAETGWSAAPSRIAVRQMPPAPAPAELHLVDTPPEKERFLHYVPVYSLEAAAGGWGPESSPTETGWLRVDGATLCEGMFVARVNGHSMEPKIPSGSWCLFRPCPAGTREGRIVLIQFQTMADPENGGRYTVKKYHSLKTQTPEDWEHGAIQLRPLNPDYKPINVQPGEAAELLIAGEFVKVVA